MMKRKTILIAVGIFLLVASCGKKDSQQDYADLYDELIINHLSLDSLSDLIAIPKTSLVQMRYGVSENKNVSDVLVEVLKACNENDKDKLVSIKKAVQSSPLKYEIKMNDEDIKAIEVKIKNLSYDIKKKEQNNSYLSQQSYDDDQQLLKSWQLTYQKEKNRKEKQYTDIQRNRIEIFSHNIPDIVFDYIDQDITEYIDNKYSIINAIPNTWNFYIKSEEKFMENFFEDFKWNDLASSCDTHYIKRLNDFKNSLIDEHKVLYGEKIDIPDFNVLPGEHTFEMDESLKSLIVERTKSQIKEISSDIFWDVLIVLIISALLSFFMNQAISDARERAIKEFFKKVRWNSGDSFLKNIGRNILSGLGSYGEYDEEVQSIKNRYARYKVIINIGVFIVGFVFSWFFIIKPQLHIENELNEELATQLMNSSSTLRINPERVLNLYLNTKDEEINNMDESLVETIYSVEEIDSTEDIVTEPDTSGKEDVSNLRQIKFSGKIGKSPIVLELVINGSEITGKYAYQSTLKKYGNKPESYFYLSGKIDEFGDMSLVSKMHNSDKPFEYITLPTKEFNHDSAISGELKNANNGDLFLIELHME